MEHFQLVWVVEVFKAKPMELVVQLMLATIIMGLFLCGHLVELH